MSSEYGYAGRILQVDLTSGEISHIPTEEYAEQFIGGRGLAAKIYWDLVPPQTKALEPENCLIFATGPLAGLPGLGGSRVQICTKTPITVPEHFNYCNVGGFWGVQLKLAGYDALVVRGASEKPVYLSIRDDVVEIRDASQFWQQSAIGVREAIKSELGHDVRVIATGPAGDNGVAFASLLADNDSSGGGSSGAVMGSKKLKAIAVRGSGKVPVADPDRLQALVERVRVLKRFREGALEKVTAEGSSFKRDVCFGCNLCVTRVSYRAEDGSHGKHMCQSSSFYTARAQRFYGGETEVPYHVNKLCDAYGLETMVMEAMIYWLVRCFYGGILTEENTGLPMSKIGSLEFMVALTRKIAFREGIGDILAQGTTRAAEIIGQNSADLITDFLQKADQTAVYGPRMLMTTGILYAMEPRQPIQQLHHVSRLLLKWVDWQKGAKGAYMSSDLLRQISKRFLGSEIAFDLSTYEGKARAAKMVQDREFAKESLILCDFAWPIMFVECSDDHMGDPTLESQIYSAVTGRETDEEGLYAIGERVFNMQRAVLVREGHLGRESDRLREPFFKVPLKNEYLNAENWAPGQDGEPFQKTGAVVDREKFEDLKTEYYGYRGWDPATGLQTRSKLHELGVEDVAAELANVGAIAQP
ncbi:MAG: aldehyde ferredoxin oxidoreductase N-terminal domain-containing protein [Dehalococcoidia bacterium]|nr:aldehyde ferredoxin oxidoreductase N-terminal domain-containing protein [Dehalococcoidia bacterium]